jgi:hypothetical protein
MYRDQEVFCGGRLVREPETCCAWRKRTTTTAAATIVIMMMDDVMTRRQFASCDSSLL